MKKIMIYSKYAHRFGGIRFDLKERADLILFFALFICGALIGSALYTAGETDYFARAAAAVAENGIEKNCAALVILAFLSCITAVMGGLSCLGVLPLLPLPLIYGGLYAMLASHLILTGAYNGLGCFSLVVLPGAVVSVTALILLCAQCAKVSKTLAAAVFFGRREPAQYKMLFIKSAVLLAFMLLGAALTFVCYKLFAGLF